MCDNLIIPAFIVKPKVMNQFDYNLYLKQQELIFYGYDPTLFPEIWLPVDCLGIKPGLYMISNYGRLYSFAIQGEISYMTSHGYIIVGLKNIDGKTFHYRLHRIVAYTFIPRTEEDIMLGRDVINHKNLCRSCNFTWNLEHVTVAENNEHARINNAVEQDYYQPPNGNWEERGVRCRGELNSTSVLTDEQVKTICQLIQDGKSRKEAAEAVGLEYTTTIKNTISLIIRGEQWKHISCDFNLKSKWKKIDRKAFVVPVCELLEQGLRDCEIMKKLNIPGNYNQQRNFIAGIRLRKFYTEISQNYNW